MNDLWQLDLVKLTWKKIHHGSASKDISVNNTNRAPLPRHLGVACGIQEKMIVLFGGEGQEGLKFGDTWAFYIPESQWLPLSEIVKRLKNETMGMVPPKRSNSQSWCLPDHLFIFGGEDKNNKMLRDMWRFDMIELRWEQTEVSSKVNDNALSSPLKKMPRGRTGAATWVGKNAALYMFSGNQLDGNFRSKHLNYGYGTDLWQYNITTSKWKLLMGVEGKCLSGVYNQMTHPNEKNIPGCRRGAVAWTDWVGNLWMFGGDGATKDPASVSNTLPSKILGDLWYYDLDLKVWYWFGGSDEADSPGNYDGPKNKYTTGIYPSSRTEAFGYKRWNELCMFGGMGHDATKAFGVLSDIFCIDVHTKVMYNNTAYPGTIFMLIFAAFCLVMIVIVTYMYVRKHFKGFENRGNMNDVEYSRLSTDAD